MSSEPDATTQESLKFTGLKTSWRKAVMPCLVFGFVWATLNPGDRLSWIVGLPVVVLAALLYMRTSSDRSGRFSPLNAVIFFCWFLIQSLKGAWQVSCRVLRSTVDVSPGFIDYTTVISEGPARRLFANCITLLPGTLVAAYETERLHLHVLDIHSENHSEVARLERRVIAMFPQSALKDDAAGAKAPRAGGPAPRASQAAASPLDQILAVVAAVVSALTLVHLILISL